MLVLFLTSFLILVWKMLVSQKKINKEKIKKEVLQKNQEWKDCNSDKLAERVLSCVCVSVYLFIEILHKTIKQYYPERNIFLNDALSISVVLVTYGLSKTLRKKD